MQEDEVPEEIIEAAEQAAELARSALADFPSREAMQAALSLQTAPFSEAAQAALASQMTPLLEAAGAALTAQMTPVLESAGAALTAQMTPLLEAAGAGLISQMTPVLEAAGAALTAQMTPVLESAGAALSFQAAQIGGALRSALPIILASQQWAEFHDNLATMLAGPLQAYAGQVALASDAGRGQLAAIAILQPALRAPAASESLTSMRPVIAGTEAAAETESVLKQEDARPRPAHPINVAALAVVLVWLWALAMPAAQEHLPPEVKDYLNGLWSTLGIALTVHLAVNDSRTH